MIIAKYVNKEISQPLLMVTLVLVLLMISYSSVSYFSDAANRVVDPEIAVKVIFAKTVVAFELFLPLSLFITILLGLGKLYTSHEIAAMNASGIGDRSIVRMLLPLILVISLVAGCIATIVRPWAYEVRYEALRVAEQTIDFEKVEAGHFYANEEAGSTYFAAKVEDKGKTKRDVFYNLQEQGRERLIYSEKAYQVGSYPPKLVFLNGSAQRLDLHGKTDWYLQFDQLTILPDDEDVAPKEYKRKAASTMYLAQANSSEEIAEYQWRLTNPLKAFLLAILAVFLSKTAPRQGRYGKLSLGIGVFFAVHLVSVLSRTWLEQGVLPVIPGLWWVPFLLLVIAAILFKRA